ncbi:MAG: DUF2283 domain-containing protein [Chloroflexi bacterium]|nr:DUF2283 domain-containing protein [Chloroflexota bacterium]
MGYEPVTYDPDADVLYVQLRAGKVARTKSLDDFRLIDYSDDGAVVGIEFIDATAGIDLKDVPFAQTVGQLIGQSGLDLKIFA